MQTPCILSLDEDTWIARTSARVIDVVFFLNEPAGELPAILKRRNVQTDTVQLSQLDSVHN